MKPKILSMICLLSLLTASCKKFFDVAPIDRLYENELFVDRYGFESALSSVYNSLGSNSLYGRELKFGFLETLVGSYNNITATGHRYYRHGRHEYTFPDPQRSINGIWSGFYNSINQLNIILNNVDNISTDPYHDLVKGEALGLRAFAHFELLKLFGPVIREEGLDAQAIPYRDALRFAASKFGTAREVIDKINADLSTARALLEEDPIRTNSRTADLNQFAYEKYNSLLDRRGVRLNYYATVALQALVAQWEGNLQTAGQYAEELLDELNVTRSITWATAANFGSNVNTNNIRTSTENIFGLHVRGLRSQSIEVLPEINDTRGVVSPLLYPNYTLLLNTLYDAPGHGSTNDYRLASWYGNNVRWKLVKYAIPESFNPIALVESSNSNHLQINAFEVKLLSLHTICLVAAESYIQTDPQKTLDYLNIARQARGLTVDITNTPALTTQGLADLIFFEFRKDNIGDGTLFAEYKRLFRAIDRASDVQPTIGIFKFPIPEDELLYNPN